MGLEAVPDGFHLKSIAGRPIMTDRQDDDVQLSESAPGQDEAQGDSAETANAQQGEQQADDQHGRPSDDSDPGHS